MALEWTQKGNLKGPKGDKGDKGYTGASIRVCKVSLSASASTNSSNITPNANIQAGDLLVDVDGDVFEVASVSGTTVKVGEAASVNVRGPQGPKGDKGEDGTGVNIKGSVANSSALPPSGEEGDAYVVTETGNLWVWDADEGAFVDTGAQIKGPKGDTGATGAAATIRVGTVTTGVEGSDAAVTNAGSTSAAVLNFTIPRGATGAQGPKGETGETGPQGPQGEKGATGEQGPQGLRGETGAQGATGPQGPKGDPGATGPQGPAGPGVRVGSGAPSGVGAAGECYIDVATGNLYQYEDAN